MARPGIMVYFDMMGPISKLPDADRGRLFWAMLEYGKNGTVPDFCGDLPLELAWEFVKPKIDKDKESYDRQIQQKQYAAFSREAKKKGLPPVSYDDWKNLSDIEKERMISDDIGWYPTTSTTPTSSTNTTTATAAAATANTTEYAAATADSKVGVIGGELGKGVVFLSNDQIADLLDKLDLETFNYYVDKLSTFIIKNGAHVMNHYETILKWWREDGAVH